MATSPLITFKAGQCHLQGKKVTADPTPGYVYLYSEDDLLHFCWRPRSEPSSEPDLDLIMFPGDGTFTPYLGPSPSSTASEKHSPTNGRIYMLKFSSSSQRHFFWMQSKSQHRDGTPSWFSQRDQQLGDIINSLLAGEEVDVEDEVAGMRQNGGGAGPAPDGDDDVMEDVQEHDTEPEHHRQGSGGAGADATGGDPREEGEESRRGGEDGGRAAASNDPNTIVQNFLRSLQGPNALPQQALSSSSSSQQQQQQQQLHDRPFTTLTELLITTTTVPYLASASPAQIDALCTHLPPSLFQSTAAPDGPSHGAAEPSPAAAKAAIDAMGVEQKRALVQRVLRSPQLHQSLGSMTVALRDGGLPMIAEALGVRVRNGGVVRGGSVPLGGGEAVEAFLDGVREGVQGEEKRTEE